MYFLRCSCTLKSGVDLSKGACLHIEYNIGDARDVKLKCIFHFVLGPLLLQNFFSNWSIRDMNGHVLYVCVHPRKPPEDLYLSVAKSGRC